MFSNYSSGSNDQNASGSGTTTATQIHYQQQMPQQQTNQMQPQQTQHVHTQPKVKLEKTVNMMYADSERTRILYNLKNNRAGAQFLAQLNPTKVVNIVPFQQHKGGQGRNCSKRCVFAAIFCFTVIVFTAFSFFVLIMDL